MLDLGFVSSELVSPAVALIALLVGMWVWFLVNRASVRANAQVRLLQEIADQQRQQIALLERLVQSAQGDSTPLDEDDDFGPTLDLDDIIPKRSLPVPISW